MVHFKKLDMILKNYNYKKQPHVNLKALKPRLDLEGLP